VSLCFLALCNAGRVPAGLPTPLQMCKITFLRPYDGNYKGTALFISKQGVDRNEPDLLFDGSQDGKASFRLSTAGFDTGLAFDLGTGPLSSVNYYNITRPPYMATYTGSVVAALGHTIAVWTFHQDIQAFWAFHVDSIDPTTRGATITYTVSYYQYVTRSQYVIANYDDHPKTTCSTPNPLPKALDTCPALFTGTYNGNYTGTALFLSPLSQQRNIPELLLEAVDGNRQSFGLETAGFDVGAAVELGSVPLASLNYYSIVRFSKTPFFETSNVDTEVGKTYAVWTLHQQIQALWAFNVEKCTPSRQCTISYTVIYYQYVDGSDYVIGDYDSYPTPTCTPV